jgi:hypothetical protein
VADSSLNRCATLLGGSRRRRRRGQAPDRGDGRGLVLRPPWAPRGHHRPGNTILPAACDEQTVETSHSNAVNLMLRTRRLHLLQVGLVNRSRSSSTLPFFGRSRVSTIYESPGELTFDGCVERNAALLEAQPKLGSSDHEVQVVVVQNHRLPAERVLQNNAIRGARCGHIKRRDTADRLRRDGCCR